MVTLVIKPKKMWGVGGEPPEPVQCLAFSQYSNIFVLCVIKTRIDPELPISLLHFNTNAHTQHSKRQCSTRHKAGPSERDPALRVYPPYQPYIY